MDQSAAPGSDHGLYPAVYRLDPALGTKWPLSQLRCHVSTPEGSFMNSIIYLVGLVVIVMAILSFIGLA